MSNISTFGTFTIARLGIYAAHKAIDIVGNNISNINTEGYTRQDIDQFSMNMGGSDRYSSLFDTRVGSGAFVTGVTQMRDQFLDIRYRDEQANVGAMEGRLGGLEGIQGVIDEVGRGVDGEGVLEARFNEMIEMMQKLNTEGAGKDEFDSLFRASAASLVNTIHSYATQLDIQAEIQDLNFRQDVEQVNTILTRIRDLNSSIRKTQVYGGNALEQQDERNLLIDELSNYTRISVTTEQEYLGEHKYIDKLVIKTADDPQRTLVNGIFATQVSIRQIPVLDDNGDPVTDEEGNPVMREDPDHSLDLATLRDVNGRALTLGEDDGGAQTITEGVKYAASLAGPDDAATQYDTLEEADEVAKALNDDADPAQADGKTYQYTAVASDGKFVIQRYDMTDVGDSGTGVLDGLVAVTESPTYSAAAPSGDGTGTLYETEEEAASIALELNKTNEDPVIFDEEGREVTVEYRPVMDQDGKYEVHRFESFHGKVQLLESELYGKLQSKREVLTKQGVFSTQEELDRDPSAASKRGLPFYQKALDVLANTLATTLNSANVAEGPLFSNNGTTNDTENINAHNIDISKDWANGSFKVDTSSNKATQSTANDNLNKILNLLTGSIHAFVPQGASGELNGDAASGEVFFTGSFQELFTNHMAGTLANDIKVANTMLNNYETVSEELYVDRDAVHGVDLNDEAMNMMMYQKSYAAACRLMTVYDSMLDRLINGTAM